MENTNAQQTKTSFFNKEEIVAEIKKPSTIVSLGIALIGAVVCGMIAKK